MKFGLRIDFDIRMRMTSSNTKPEVVLNHRKPDNCRATTASIIAINEKSSDFDESARVGDVD